MHDDTSRSPGGIGQRTKALQDAIARAEREDLATIGLPEQMEPGTFSFTYMTDAWSTGDLQAQDIAFEWDGGRTATWTEDISMHEAITPASSSPTSGWASWVNGRDVLLAYASEELGFEGWARLEGRAPMEGDTEETSVDPQDWVQLARMITAVIQGAALERSTGARFEID